MVNWSWATLVRPWKHTGLRYLVAGGFNTAFAYGLFAICYHLLSPYVHYMVVLVCSTVLNITVAFLNYKFLVFRTRGNYIREYLRFYAVYAAPIALGFVLFPLGVEVLHLNAYVTQALITLIAVILGYFGHKHFSFRRASPPPVA
jgi:putative flippase GtrA